MRISFDEFDSKIRKLAKTPNNAKRIYKHRLSHRLKSKDHNETDIHNLDRPYWTTPGNTSGKLRPIGSHSLSPVLSMKDKPGAVRKLDISVCPIYAV